MKTQNTSRNRYRTLGFLLTLLVCVGCGDDNGPEEEQTGTVLQGTVVEFQAQVVPGGFGLAAVEGVTVAIGSKSTQTDANGNFSLRNFLIGNQNVDFSRDGGGGTMVLTDVEPGAEYEFLFSINGGQVSTQHTGTWVGTGGSTDPGSQGPVALTMIIAQNGNSVTGTASIGAPDNTSWNITGTENGRTLHNTHLTVTSTNTNNLCAAGAELLDATFVGDTLSGRFREEDVPEDCGSPEEGEFRVVKQ